MLLLYNVSNTISVALFFTSLSGLGCQLLKFGLGVVWFLIGQVKGDPHIQAPDPCFQCKLQAWTGGLDSWRGPRDGWLPEGFEEFEEEVLLFWWF